MVTDLRKICEQFSDDNIKVKIYLHLIHLGESIYSKDICNQFSDDKITLGATFISPSFTPSS